MSKLILLLLLSPNIFGLVAKSVDAQQRTAERSTQCSKENTNKKKYSVLSVGRGVELQIDLAIKAKYRSDENYLAISREIRRKYCDSDRVRISFYSSKESWKIVDLTNLAGTPLAIYFSGGKDTDEKEGISVYEVVEGKVNTRKLDVAW